MRGFPDPARLFDRRSPMPRHGAAPLLRSRLRLLLRTTNRRNIQHAELRLPNQNQCQPFPKLRPPSPRLPTDSPRIRHSRRIPSSPRTSGAQNPWEEILRTYAIPPVKPPRANQLRPAVSNDQFPIPISPAPRTCAHNTPTAAPKKAFPLPPSAFPLTYDLRLTPYAPRPTPPPPPQ